MSPRSRAERTAGVRWFREADLGWAGAGLWIPASAFDGPAHPAFTPTALAGVTGAALFAAHLHMTCRLENELIGPVARWIASGELGPDEDLRVDALRLQCDESFHALLCAGLLRRLTDDFGLDLADLPEPLYLRTVRGLRASLAGRASPAQVDFAAAVVAETIVTKTLGEDWRDPALRPAVRAFLKLHHEDEARHSACLAQALCVAWRRWEARHARRRGGGLGGPGVGLHRPGRRVAGGGPGRGWPAAEGVAAVCGQIAASRPRLGGGGEPADHAPGARPRPDGPGGGVSAPLAAHAQPLFFRYGEGGEPLALLGGSLIFDSGEAEESYLFRCQDRFYSSAVFLRLRPIFFAADADHAARYAPRLAAWRAASLAITQATGLFRRLALLPPLFAGLRLEDLAVSSLPSEVQLWRPAAPGPAMVLLKSGLAHRRGPASPAESGGGGPWAAPGFRRSGVRSGRAARASPARQAAGPRRPRAGDRRRCGAAPPAGRGADARGIPGARRLGRPDRPLPGPLGRRQRAGRAGGQVRARFRRQRAAVFSPGRFAVAAASLAAELAAWNGEARLADILAEARRDVSGSPMLQVDDFPDARLMRFSAGAEPVARACACWSSAGLRRCAGSRERPAAVDMSFFIHPDGTPQTLCVAAQTYQDVSCQHFRGGAAGHGLRGGLPRRRPGSGHAPGLPRPGRRGLLGTGQFRRPAGCGRPIHAHRRLQSKAQRRPPPLALRRALAAEGRAPRIVLSLGYRGEFHIPDLDGALAALARQRWLDSLERPHGLLIWPSLVRDDAYDLCLVDTPAPEAVAIIEGPPATASPPRWRRRRMDCPRFRAVERPVVLSGRSVHQPQPGRLGCDGREVAGVVVEHVELARAPRRSEAATASKKRVSRAPWKGLNR